MTALTEAVRGMREAQKAAIPQSRWGFAGHAAIKRQQEAEAVVDTLLAEPAAPVNDKTHPRFMAGYDAGLHDRELEQQSLAGCHPSEPAAPQAEPSDLHPRTADLVDRFASALKEKLATAEKKYGYSDGWASIDWMDECKSKLRSHIAKGDPRDVAAYCAFLRHHGATTLFDWEKIGLDYYKLEHERRPAPVAEPAASGATNRISVLDAPAYANERAQAELLDALKDATAHLAGAASAYRTYGKRSPHLGKVPADAFFTTRADDFDKAVERARTALAASAPPQPVAQGDVEALRKGARTITAGDGLPYMTLRFSTLNEAYKANDELNAIFADRSNLQVGGDVPNYQALYHELLYAVARKYHGQSRHETALMYIQNAERNGQVAAAPSSTGSEKP